MMLNTKYEKQTTGVTWNYLLAYSKLQMKKLSWTVSNKHLVKSIELSNFLSLYDLRCL